jgi:hypothetical protein
MGCSHQGAYMSFRLRSDCGRGRGIVRFHLVRLFAVVGAVALLAAVAPAGPASAAAGFGDVAGDAYYTAPVQWLVDESITTGTSPGCFNPDRAVTRGEIATFIWRYANQPTPTGPEPFTDVQADDFYATAVAWMFHEAITTGTTATTFNPNRPVTRGETATFLWRYANQPTTTITPGGTCTTTPPTTTTNPPTTTTVPSSGDRFETLPPGAALPSGAECAQRVRPAPETRPGNTSYNNTPGAGPHPDYPRVDGNFTGTTDEILQWAACKWGLDEDIVRAQTAKESWWYQTAGGDLSNNPSDCHPSVRDQDPCPESIGVLQVRYLYHGPAMNDSIASTAYNADYTYAAWRSCYNGNETWLNQFERGGTYAAGDVWGCLGVWFSGRWLVSDALVYMNDVEDLLNDRVWEQNYFLA